MHDTSATQPDNFGEYLLIKTTHNSAKLTTMLPPRHSKQISLTCKNKSYKRKLSSKITSEILSLFLLISPDMSQKSDCCKGSSVKSPLLFFCLSYCVPVFLVMIVEPSGASGAVTVVTRPCYIAPPTL